MLQPVWVADPTGTSGPRCACTVRTLRNGKERMSYLGTFQMERTHHTQGTLGSPGIGRAPIDLDATAEK